MTSIIQETISLNKLDRRILFLIDKKTVCSIIARNSQKDTKLLESIWEGENDLVIPVTKEEKNELVGIIKKYYGSLKERFGVKSKEKAIIGHSEKTNEYFAYHNSNGLYFHSDGIWRDTCKHNDIRSGFFKSKAQLIGLLAKQGYSYEKDI